MDNKSDLKTMRDNRLVMTNRDGVDDFLAGMLYAKLRTAEMLIRQVQRDNRVSDALTSQCKVALAEVRELADTILNRDDWYREGGTDESNL